MKQLSAFESMKTSHLKAFLFLMFLIISTNGLFAQKSYSADDMVGKWVTHVNEPVDGKCKIIVNWKADQTADFSIVYKNQAPYSSSVTWSLDGDTYYETYSDGTPGKGKIRWINKNKFALTILENNATELYKGRVRVYKRIKN